MVDTDDTGIRRETDRYPMILTDMETTVTLYCRLINVLPYLIQ